MVCVSTGTDLRHRGYGWTLDTIMNRILVFGAALALLAGCSTTRVPERAPADSPSRVVDAAARARIDATLSGFVAAGSIAGASALIFEKGEEVYFNAFGMADREAGVPMRRDALVQILSMTKPVTGVALMQLQEEGLLQLDDPVADHAPEFASVMVYAGRDSSGAAILERPLRPITIRDLTRHTAGFATGSDRSPPDDLYRAADPMRLENTLGRMAERLAAVPLAFHPGERWSYGPSVDVQAYLVERISGKPFDAYLLDHVFGPLRMRDTHYLVPEADRGRLAALYHRSPDGVLFRVPDAQAFAFNTRRWPLTPGGYGLVSTIDDYMRFARMLLHDGELDGARVLRPETVRQMATNHLSDSVTERSWLPSKGQVGFGIDFAVRLRPAAGPDENVGTVGEFFWDGAASTLFWVDPAHELAAVLFVQLMPFDQVGLHKDFRDAVYGPFTGAVAADRL
jgi:CubicO group peptidase (beta-lactamase class C family)